MVAGSSPARPTSRFRMHATSPPLSAAASTTPALFTARRCAASAIAPHWRRRFLFVGRLVLSLHQPRMRPHDPQRPRAGVAPQWPWRRWVNLSRVPCRAAARAGRLREHSGRPRIVYKARFAVELAEAPLHSPLGGGCGSAVPKWQPRSKAGGRTGRRSLGRLRLRQASRHPDVVHQAGATRSGVSATFTLPFVSEIPFSINKPSVDWTL
jgi:hypothetical protein